MEGQLKFYYKINKITDKIYLGSEEGSSDKKLLKEYKVTHILVCGSELKKRFKGEFVYEKYELEDRADENILKFFENAFDFIDSADVVFVHCLAGVSRSATIVVAYLMYKYKLSLKEATEYVKNKRKVINPNRGFVKQLQIFDKLLWKHGNKLDMLMLKKIEYENYLE